MTRAFVAVRPPDPVLDAVAARVAGVEVEGARLTTRDQWHMTLQFLGNRADLDAVVAALGPLAICAGSVQFGGAGAFPNARRARVLWLGVRAGDALLVQLAAAVGALLSPLGHVPESRPYHPHLTLARCKTPTDVRGAVDGFGDAPVGDPWRVGEIVVFESKLRRAGAEYLPRASIALPG